MREEAMKRVFVTMFVLVIVGAVPALADAPQTGTLEGRVLDAGGGPLPGITVTLVGDRGEQTTVTGEQGRYLFGLLPPGVYTVMATVEGLEEARICGPGRSNRPSRSLPNRR
jgi:protocatechuate 3,4-dioxygenase beta subunit